MIIRTHSLALFAVAHGILQNREEAEDVVLLESAALLPEPAAEDKPRMARFGVREFLVAAVVATLVDEFPAAARSACGDSHGYCCFAEEEPRAVEVDVGQEEFHGAALGDFPGFVQILLRALGAGARAGEKRSQARVRRPRGRYCCGRRGGGRPRRCPVRGRSDCPDAAFRVPNFLSSQESPRRARRGPGEVVEGDGRGGRSVRRFTHLSVCAARWETAVAVGHGRRMLGESQTADYRSFATRRARGRRGAGRNTGSLAASRAAGTRAGSRPAFPRLRGNASPPRPGGPPGAGRRHGSCAADPLKRIAAAVGVGHGLLGVPHRPGHLAQRQLQLAQVAGVDGSVFPVFAA